MSAPWVVFGKELKDALRDRRTWIVVVVVALLAGPVMLVVLSKFFASIQETVARREVFLTKPAAAPSLVNFVRRAGGNVREAPPDFREQIRSGDLHNAVVVIPDDFENQLLRGDTIRLDVVYDGSSTRGQGPSRATQALLRGFARELGTQRLLTRGVSPQVLTPVDIDNVDLASAKARGAQSMLFLPLAALIAAVLGAVSIAIDVTAGERERGSLEPLLMNPVALLSIVLGKWGVVFASSAAVVVLTLIGYFAAMTFIPSETLAAMWQFGIAEAAVFLLMLLPFCAMIAAVTTLSATYGRTHKEAQVYISYLTTVVNILPIVSIFISNRDALWQLFVPALGQQVVMMRVLGGESVTVQHLLLPAAVALAITAAAIAAQVRLLGAERIVFSR